MSNRSCGNCGTSDTDIIDIKFDCPTVWGSFPVETQLCKTCKSVAGFALSHYLESYDYLMDKIQGRRLQLSNKIKKLMK